jgi:hypothetical protein
MLTSGIAAWILLHAFNAWNEKVIWSDIALGFGLLILFCLAALYKVIRNIEYIKIEQSALFIFSAAFLLYASYSFILMLFADHFTTAPTGLRQQIWSVHNILNVLKNLAIARVLFLQQKAGNR